MYVSVAQAETKRGTHRVMLTATIVLQSLPGDVATQADVSLNDDSGDVPKFLASARKPISLSAAEPDAIDGVVILGVLEEKLVANERTEVSVLVSYNLYSHENGRIMLGFNSSGPTQLMTVADVPVKRGNGEVVLTGMVLPRFWGENAFFRASVILTEDPRPKTWQPLAEDTEPVEVVPTSSENRE
jgi:hypothetical protein